VTGEPDVSRARIVAAGVLSAGVAVVLLAALLDRPAPSVNLTLAVRDALPASGVEHPITAVLLQFRSYDTLLEIAVLLVAAVVALALREERAGATSHATTAAEDAAIHTPLLRSLRGVLLPAMIVTAVYLLWAGTARPGGAFQSGAVLAALGVLWRVSGEPLPLLASPRWQRVALLAGFTVFLGAAMAMLVLGRPLLDWPPRAAKALIIVIETALTLSIGASLLGLFASAPDPTDPRP
jgi:multisubunit Na+/H+ antiporter MnhB subunit